MNSAVGRDQINLRLGLFAALAALALSAGHAAAPENPIVGTWKLNVAKSTFTPGPGWRSQTRTYAATPGGASVSWTGVGASGETMHVSYSIITTGKTIRWSDRRTTTR